MTERVLAIGIVGCGRAAEDATQRVSERLPLRKAAGSSLGPPPA